MPLSSTPSHGFTVGADTSLTFSHTSDANPLYVLMSWWVSSGGTDATDVIDSVTYNGTALTRGGRTAVAGNTMEWWRLQSPAAGTANVVVSLNASRRISAGALNLTGWPSEISDHVFEADGANTAPPSVEIDSRVGGEVLSWIGFNHEDQDVTVPAVTDTTLWNEEGQSVTPGGSTGDQRTAAILAAGAETSVTFDWAGTETAEYFGVGALSFTSAVGRHLIAGTSHTVSGLNNVVTGASNAVSGNNSQAHGTQATVVANRSVLYANDGDAHTLTDDNTFEAHFDAIRLNADEFLVNGNTLSTATRVRTVGLTIDGQGDVLTTGAKGFVRVPFTGTITKATLLSTDASVTSGSLVIDVWKDTYANYPPTDADSITASAPPTLSSATKSEDTTLTGWTTSVSAGDVFGFNVDSVTSITRATLMLDVEES